MVTLRGCLVAAAASLAPIGTVVQAPVGPPLLVSRPVRPLQGSLVVVAVRPPAGDSVVAVTGDLAGEPLHFEPVAVEWHAVGAVPLDASDSVLGRVIIARAGGATDTMVAVLRVTRRSAPRERLRVAPELVQAPDSLAERIRLERELVDDLRRRSHDTPRLWREPFMRPRPSAVKSVFGVSRRFNGVVRSRHFGVDFAGRPGAPVRAANRGIVVFEGDLYYSGRTLFIDHGAGLVTGYFHLSQALVAPSDTVARGQVIGHVGSSGRVTGPHLHWFAAYGAITVDPFSLVTLDLERVLTPARADRAPEAR
ncbi:MAG TPA: M23 family metallopeptidase [Gemmatimonadales bacterium]|jgi:murein DD-endopeptidase MepM/ murein hydrolase activator NlpD|nr:M23 family metallopeptidase [Gemmatimonadales bacterium]